MYVEDGDGDDACGGDDSSGGGGGGGDDGSNVRDYQRKTKQKVNKTFPVA